MIRDPSAVVLAGDWHGNSGWARYVIGLLPKLLLGEENPVILHAGDFGFWPGSVGRQYLNEVNEALWDADAVLFFVDGNHEWHPELRRIQEKGKGVYRYGPNDEVWVHENIAWLPRGSRWTWHGKTWLALGGAVSVDAAMRTKGRDWWPEEMLSAEDIRRAVEGGPVDVMLCHDAPSEAQLHLDPPSRLWDIMDLARADAHREQLQGVVERVCPRLLVHGHYHRRVQSTVPQVNLRYLGLDMDGEDGNYTVLDTRTLEEVSSS